ncbi:PQ-loop-domain-containing protein [Coniophora puteana RWD-64-598 SS2]|uniref:PQ-loop-domain-containing protein n=1 Tax=Coniophora puteana (strain RWD-64-598) TaxID=741705 RepID=A0A5M3MPD5_CONPW|nr:PQ-loop-domain-containing protein [Coniophora puteana RWD-64-598 SS2]EIW81042.1 PQ-loop-domain-containing protein [Coniophora puteana RWD-64-598 SS2]
MIITGDTASSVLGWISIACWVIVYSPQIIETYQLQSGEGLSLLFVYIWLAGDLCNVIGAIMGGLLPTVVILGVYYTLCDSTLLLQVYYYRWKSRQRLTSPAAPTEEDPLIGISILPLQDRRPSAWKIFFQYTAAVVFVCLTGVGAYFISESLQGRQQGPQALESLSEGKAGVEWEVQIIGWTSAILFLGSRIPQILKNFKTRCEGLAPGLFLFAILGNTTYALSICAASMDPDYLIKNSSWLAGSALTVFFDLIVLGQFFYYGFVSRQRGWIEGTIGES